MSIDSPDGEIIVYVGDDGKPRINVTFQGETAWLTQTQLAELFQTTKQNVSLHIKNVLEEGELERKATVKDFLTVQNEGGRDVSRSIEYYNLDMIISLGYRVKSHVATKFRIWATQRLREYIIKGFTMDDERLKGNSGGDYWKELLDRIRDIRSSEKAIYRQVLDLYATSHDYDPKSPQTAKFFKIFQNKLHYATSEQTAAEIVHTRADNTKDFMGMTTFAGAVPTIKEAVIAKNYLTEDELFTLNRLVSAFFDLAEIKAKQQQVMNMEDWVAELDKFSLSYGKGILKGAGGVSHNQMVKKAIIEFRKYEARTLSPIEKEYLDSIKVLQSTAEKKLEGKTP